MEDLNQGSDQIPDEQSLYQRKYYALKRKCEEVQQTNEKLVNRIQHVKKVLRRRKKEKELIMARLDKYGDAYMDVRLPAMFDEIEPDRLSSGFSGQRNSPSICQNKSMKHGITINSQSPSPFIGNSTMCFRNSSVSIG